MSTDRESPWEKRRRYLEMLTSTTCQCGASKTPRHSFCKSCFEKLPDRLRLSLYDRIGSGYESAFEESCKTLGLSSESRADRQTGGVVNK